MFTGRAKHTWWLLMAAVIVLVGSTGFAAQGRHTIDLNGTWEFEQTNTAFPPTRFTRVIPVPGLIGLARPKVEDYDKLFQRPDRVEHVEQFDLARSKHRPKYNWYRRAVSVPKEYEGSEAVLTILKSKYVTNAFVNGIDVGTSSACYTPIDFPVTAALKFGRDNEILIRVGDRAHLPSAAAGSTDKEKANYLPGIWDDVELSFTGKLRLHRVLMLPKVSEKKVTAKILVRSFYPPQTLYGGRMQDVSKIEAVVKERKSGRVVKTAGKEFKARRDNITEIELDIPMVDAQLWTPDKPFLYTAETVLYDRDKTSDRVEVHFGMRDFGRNGRYFTLNGRKILLRGTNITLHRFFEDPDCQALPWDREWVTRLLHEIPKQLNWNAMRVCVGIAPKMWYDIADESGLLLQNEWLYWQTHGWDEEIKTEYTDWVWADGSHPSIAIWDAINENWDSYIGNVLIPELKELDPTRIWDAGYMTSSDMALDEMDEPHPYMVWGGKENFAKYMNAHPYPLGDLQYRPDRLRTAIGSSAAQLVNEYGWIWLWRDGRPAKLTVNNYRYYLGDGATAQQRRRLQAYWLQCQTEWLRSERSLAGVLAFCYLTNNYGFTGDWFVGDIGDLQPGPTLEWFRSCFAPAAVFIDLVDERYTKYVKPHRPGEELTFNLVGVNDYGREVAGEVVVRLLDEQGRPAGGTSAPIVIDAYGRRDVPVNVKLPGQAGGYLLLAEFTAQIDRQPSTVISRRYIKVGEQDEYRFYEYEPEPLED